MNGAADGLALLALVLAVVDVRPGRLWQPSAGLAVAGAIAARAVGASSWLLALCALLVASCGWWPRRPIPSQTPRWAEFAACGLVVAGLAAQAHTGPGFFTVFTALLPLLLVGLLVIALGRVAQGGVVASLAGVLALVEQGDDPGALGASVVLVALLALASRTTLVPTRFRLAAAALTGLGALALVGLGAGSWLSWAGLAVATACTWVMLDVAAPRLAHLQVAACVAGLAMMLSGTGVLEPFARPAFLAGLVLNGAVLLGCRRGGVPSMAAVLVMDAGLVMESFHSLDRLALPLGLAVTAWAAWRLRRASPRQFLALAAAGHGGIALACCGLGGWSFVICWLHLVMHALAHACALLGGRRWAVLALAGLPPAGLFFSEWQFLGAVAREGWIVLPAAAILAGFSWAVMRARPPSARAVHPAIAWTPWVASCAIGLALLVMDQ